MDATSLATRGIEQLGPLGVASAHPKVDRKRNEWVHFGQTIQSKDLALFTLGSDGQVKHQRNARLDSPGYSHDFFVSERYIVFSPNPVGFNPFGLLTGTSAPAACFRWNDPQSRDVYVFEREGNAPAVRFEAPASFMWHSVNAFDTDTGVVCDFVGYDNPDHFIGADPSFWAIMDGRRVALHNPGKLRRWRIDVARGRLQEDIRRETFTEYPTVHPSYLCGTYRYAWVAAVNGKAVGHPWNGVERIDMETGDVDAFFFGVDHWLANGESVFAPDPDGNGESDGWLLSLVYDHGKQRSYLTVLRADHISDGPVARILLEHHTPLSFHGSWQPA